MLLSLFFWLEVYLADINGTTVAIFKFLFRTQKNELQMAKISTFAEISKWSVSPI